LEDHLLARRNPSADQTAKGEGDYSSVAIPTLLYLSLSPVLPTFQLPDPDPQT
jgi:hypothetical protein